MFVCLFVCLFPGLIGYDMAVKAATEAYEQAGVGPQEVGVVDLHDCFSTNELITYEALVHWEGRGWGGVTIKKNTQHNIYTQTLPSNPRFLHTQHNL